MNIFADDKIKVHVDLVQMMISVFDWKENIVGKGENAGHQHFFSYSNNGIKCPLFQIY